MMEPPLAPDSLWLNQVQNLGPALSLTLKNVRCIGLETATSLLFSLRRWHLVAGFHFMGDKAFYQRALETLIGNVLELQSIITTFDDPQVEIHLLSSCLGICKINHPLRTVPNDLVPDQLLIIII